MNINNKNTQMILYYLNINKKYNFDGHLTIFEILSSDLLI